MQLHDLLQATLIKPKIKNRTREDGLILVGVEITLPDSKKGVGTPHQERKRLRVPPGHLGFGLTLTLTGVKREFFT